MLLLLGAGCPATQNNGAVTGKPENAGYQAYEPAKLALAKTDTVVLFFAADWCPTCREADANLSKTEIPAHLHILKVDYDSSIDLKKKYGVTYQHTFVRVDADGNMLKKWSGSTTVEEIQAQI